MPLSRINSASIANNAVAVADLANSGVTAGTYGGSSNISVVTVNAQGLVTSASNVSLSQIIKPSITAPANNATGVQDSQLITASPYLSLYGRSQANAEWQLSTSSSFAFINVSSTVSGSNTEFQLNTASGLVTNTVYYARVRYSDNANTSSEYSDTVNFTSNTVFSVPINFLVLAGGGGGSANRGAGGGGAGGYRASLGTSGGPSSAESAINIVRSTNYTVTVGGGGAGGDTGPGVGGANGSPSVFATVTSLGGGTGGSNINTWSPGGPYNGASGGSGGGGGAAPSGPGSNAGGTGTPGQGNPGGTSTASSPNAEGGAGGGGAGAAGTPNSTPNSGTTGGAGISSSTLFGPATTRGGGGGGGGWSGGAPGGSGGGGTGQAGPANPSSPGATNTGGGGGGGGGQPASGGSGGSGIVLLQYPPTVTLSNPGGGLTYTTAPVSGNTVATFTAGTGNVSWS